MTGMETFLIGAAGGVFASLALSKANQLAVRWQATENAIMAHEATLGVLVQQGNVPICNCDNPDCEAQPQTGGQYL